MNHKNLTTVFFSIFASVALFAGNFEGVILQESTTSENGSLTMEWVISGDNIALKLSSDNDVYTFVPKGSELLMYSSKIADDGNYYYSLVPTSLIESNIESFDVRKVSSKLDVQGYSCEKVSLNGNASGTILYAESISVNLAKFVSHFKDSYEITALAKLNLKGFPLAVDVMTNGKTVSKINTLKIESKEINSSEFQIPTGYKEASIGK